MIEENEGFRQDAAYINIQYKCDGIVHVCNCVCMAE